MRFSIFVLSMCLITVCFPIGSQSDPLEEQRNQQQQQQQQQQLQPTGTSCHARKPAMPCRPQKSGLCPPATHSFTCAYDCDGGSYCESDCDCDGIQKCCSTRCAGKECLPPALVTAVANSGQQGSESAGQA